jgi:hypothetical protein
MKSGAQHESMHASSKIVARITAPSGAIQPKLARKHLKHALKSSANNQVNDEEKHRRKCCHHKDHRCGQKNLVPRPFSHLLGWSGAITPSPRRFQPNIYEHVPVRAARPYN